MHRAYRSPGALTTLVGLLALALYAGTLSPTVGFVDSGELTLAAWELGVPHPPGFPLYVLLTHLAAILPAGSIAYRVNFASALFAAATAAGVFQLTFVILGRNRLAKSPDARTVGAGVAGLLYAGLRAPWSYGTIAEVYALAVCLLVCMWVLMFTASTRNWRAAALLFGLSLGVHPAIAITSLPPLAVLVLRTKGMSFVISREFLILTLLAIAGTASYAYLPVAALRDPVLNWGDPRTLDRVWAHVTGWQYRGSVEMSTLAFATALRRFAEILIGQFGAFPPVGLAIAVIGAIVTLRRDGLIFSVVGMLLATNVVLTAWMNAGWSSADAAAIITTEDIDAYYLPAFVACAVFAGLGAAQLFARALAAARRRRWPAIAATAIAVVTIFQPLTTNWRLVDRHDDRAARNYVDDVLRSIAPNGMLLLRDWQLSSPLMYMLHAEHARPDVLVVDLNLMERRWYTDGLERRYPDVFAPVSAQLVTFRQRVAPWEKDPTIIQRDTQYRSALSAAFEDLAMALVTTHLAHAPVYVTFEVAVGSDGKGEALARRLRTQYQLVPEGLVFKLASKDRWQEPAAVQLDAAHIREIATWRGADHVVSQRVLPVYRDMLISRGLQFEANGRCASARPAYAAALQIDSSSTIANAAIGRCGGR